MFWFVLSLAACGSEEAVAPPAAIIQVPLGASADVVAATWQVRMAKADARAPYEGRASWLAWYDQRRPEAIAAFASESDGPGLSRAHAEYAAIYRQAALIAANAALQVYGDDRQPSDPAEVDYLLGIAHVFTKQGDPAASFGKNGKSTAGDFAKRDATWAAWVKANPGAMPDEPSGLAAIQGKPGDLPGGSLVPTPLPLVGEPGAVDGGDPADLYALSRWHEAQARAADPASAEAVDLVLDPFRLPFEARHLATGAPVSDTWLFMSAYTSAADMQFVSKIAAGDLPGAEALAPTSAYAAIAHACSTTGKVDADCVIDQAAQLGQAIEAGMAAQNGGQADGFHRPFADYARAGALRAVDIYARARGENDTSGVLRINSFDRSIGHAADPVFIVFLAAWDAGNRNTTRATELVHQQLSTVPGLVIARAPLDALHIRLSRNAAPGVPTH